MMYRLPNKELQHHCIDASKMYSTHFSPSKYSAPLTEYCQTVDVIVEPDARKGNTSANSKKLEQHSSLRNLGQNCLSILLGPI